MRVENFVRPIFVVVALLAGSAALADESEVHVLLERPLAVGMAIKANEHVLRQNLDISDGGQRVLPFGFIESTATFTQTVKSLTVNNSDNESEIAFDTMSYRLDPTQSMASAECVGAQVELGNIPEQTFVRKDGKPINASELVALKCLFLKTSNHPGVTDTELFGTNRAVKVGEKWPVNSARFAEETGEIFQVELHPNNVTGWAKLNGFVTKGTIPCMDITLHLDVTGIAASPIFAAFQPDDATMVMQMRTLYPVDPHLPCLDARHYRRVQIVKSIGDVKKVICFDETTDFTSVSVIK